MGRRIFIGDSNKCQLILNYLKTFDDINNWIISVRNYYEYEVKIVNMKHPKYKQIIRLINLSTEHGIFQQKVNRFKYVSCCYHIGLNDWLTLKWSKRLKNNLIKYQQIKSDLIN